MAKYRWPTDPKGKAPSHSITYEQHQKNSGVNYGNNNGPAWADWIGKNSAAVYGTPPPAEGGPPPDPQLIAAQAATQRGVGLADAQATYDTGRINRDFGYNAQGAVDPSNPYSRAALLDRSFKQGNTGDTNSYAAQGQLYSGARQNQANARTFGYLSDSNSLKNQYTDALGQTTLNQANAYSNAGSALTPEILASIKRALGQ